MAIKIGINGFGRIGRLVFRAAIAPVSYTHLDVYKRQEKRGYAGCWRRSSGCL